MLNKTLLFFFASLTWCCNNAPNVEENKSLETTELKKVEQLEKTQKQREDSVLAKWQKKMDESKVGDE